MTGRDRPAENGWSSGAVLSHWPFARACGGIQAAARADEGVAADQVQAEPGGLQATVHDAEPDRDFGELDGGLVEVHAVAVVPGDVGLDPLPGGGAGVLGSSRVGRSLPPAAAGTRRRAGRWPR